MWEKRTIREEAWVRDIPDLEVPFSDPQIVQKQRRSSLAEACYLKLKAAREAGRTLTNQRVFSETKMSSGISLIQGSLMGGYTVVQNGLLFGANTSGKTYISLYQHRGNGSQKHKSKWAQSFSSVQEHALFCTADTSAWHDAAGHYWAVYNGGDTAIGERGEVLCKFPVNGNPNTPWHGYPVSPADERDGDCPPDDFVEGWRQAGVVTKTLARRIQKRKV